MDDAPKSALERLRQKDREAGVEERPLTPEQRAAIAEARQFCEAKLAEREILHQAAVRKARDAEALAALEQEYRRDRDRLAADRDHKIEQIRGKP